MKKLFITFIATLLPMLAMGQLLYERDFTGITEFTGWYMFDDSQTDGKVGLNPDGLAITVGIQTGQLWLPEVMVVPDGSFDLEEDGNYKVVVTAKFPTSGTLQINMGTWSANDQAQFPVEATGDFQTVDCDFEGWSVDAEGAHLLFQCGDFKGTTILKKIQVFDMGYLDFPASDICYNYIAKGKIAEVIPKTNGKYYGSIEIPAKVIHEGVEYTVTKISNNAFSNSLIKKITIPNGVTIIGNSAFAGCSHLTSINIPNSVTSIENDAFAGCSRLATITIPNSVTNISSCAFANCTSLSSITIPNSVSTIGFQAFYGCTGLTSVTIPNSVTSIGQYAFQNCCSLTSVTISNHVTSLEGTFIGCNGLTSITIPNSVTSIEGAFWGCSALTSITIPNSVIGIGGSTFKDCCGLTSITIPNSVISIGESAFSGCSGLTAVTIGSGVRDIWNNAFASCTNLADVYCLVEDLGDSSHSLYTSNNTFDGSYIEYATLHVPESVIYEYKTKAPWSGFGTFETLSGDAPLIPKCATPTISYVNGEISFSSETEGVEYVSELSSSDVGNKYTDNVSISGKITVKVYATKSGYDKSDTATAVIEVPGELKGDLNNDGTVNVADHVELTKIIMNED